MNVEVIESNGELVLILTGELDLSSAPQLDEELTRAEASDAVSVVIDLERVEFIDSTGLKTLLKHALISSQNGGRLRVTKGAAQARRLFELTGTVERLPFVEA